MSCSHPVDAAILADYWLGMLPDSEEDTVEQHLFGCDGCGDRLREVIALIEEVRRLARNGSLRVVVSDVFLERATADGARIRQYDLPAGGSVQCTVTADDDILIARLAADLSGAGRVDLCFCDERGVEQLRLQDVPHPPGEGSVIYQESMTYAKALPTTTMIARLVSVDDTGSERTLGEYTLNHTRSLPGPGGS